MRIKSLVTKSAGLLLAVGLSACGPKGVDLASAIPEDSAAKINVPGGGNGQALVGDRSALYEHTYNISRGINGGVGFVLALSRAIAKEEPTKVEGDTYTWGPSEPKGLERISYRF